MKKKVKESDFRFSESQLKEIKKILIIQQKPFGDILLNTGYFAELRKKFPRAQIDYLIQRPYITILKDNPHLDNLVIMEKEKGWKYYFEQIKTILKVRKEKYDLVIDQLRGTSSARIVMLSGAEYKLGFKRKKWNFIYNVKATGGEVKYHSRIKFDLLAPLGIKEVEHDLEYIITKESFAYIVKWLRQANLRHKKIIVFSPGTPVRRKQWLLENYAKLGDLIQQKTDFTVVILWGPEEKEDAEYIKKLMKTEVIIAPPTSFNQAGALLNYSQMLICNDGGINHLAVSQKKPSIAVFGPASNPKKWVAWHKNIHFYLKDWNFKNKADNSFNISPSQVFEMMKKFFDSNNSHYQS